MWLTASCGAGFGPPSGNRLLCEPDREAAALAQGRVILGPIHDPVPLLGNAVTASGIGFERHSRIRDLEGTVLLCVPVSAAKSLIRATRWCQSVDALPSSNYISINANS
jgi:hypothetical protein